MQERVKTSFIPKQSLKTERRRSNVQSSVGIINTIATIILIIAILAAVGIFLFENFTKQSIERKRESLERARAAFEPATIKELSRIDQRLKEGGLLLNSHVALSFLFDEVETITLESVRYKDFSFAESGPGRMTVIMAGEALSFNALALQSDAFGSSDFFSEVIFDGLNIDTNGNVVFSFSGVVDLNQLSYRARQTAPTIEPSVEPPVGDEAAAPDG